jgi:CRP-like cAMP-binding protein
MKELAKNKSESYATLIEMFEDIDAFLKGEINFCHRYYEKGTVLMREGETGTESFLIVKGKLSVDKNHGGKMITISILKKGDIVGEMSLITSETRSATVTALEDTEVMVLTQELFTQHLTKLPPWLGKTIYLLAERLKVANEKL